MYSHIFPIHCFLLFSEFMCFSLGIFLTELKKKKDFLCITCNTYFLWKNILCFFFSGNELSLPLLLKIISLDEWRMQYTPFHPPIHTLKLPFHCLWLLSFLGNVGCQSYCYLMWCLFSLPTFKSLYISFVVAFLGMIFSLLFIQLGIFNLSLICEMMFFVILCHYIFKYYFCSFFPLFWVLLC